MQKKGKSFFCAIWGQQIYEAVCIHRFKKGLKKCAGCPKGKELLEQKIAELKEEQLSVVRGQSFIAKDNGQQATDTTIRGS